LDRGGKEFDLTGAAPKADMELRPQHCATERKRRSKMPLEVWPKSPRELAA